MTRGLILNQKIKTLTQKRVPDSSYGKRVNGTLKTMFNLPYELVMFCVLVMGMGVLGVLLAMILHLVNWLEDK